MIGQWPTKIARRSAFTRSAWSTVLARIHNPRPRATPLRDVVCRCQPRSPTLYSAFPSMARDLPRVGGVHVRNAHLAVRSALDRLALHLEDRAGAPARAAGNDRWGQSPAVGRRRF